MFLQIIQHVSRSVNSSRMGLNSIFQSFEGLSPILSFSNYRRHDLSAFGLFYLWLYLLSSPILLNELISNQMYLFSNVSKPVGLILKNFLYMQKGNDFFSHEHELNTVSKITAHLKTIISELDEVLKTKGGIDSYSAKNGFYVSNLREESGVHQMQLVRQLLERASASLTGFDLVQTIWLSLNNLSTVREFGDTARLKDLLYNGKVTNSIGARKYRKVHEFMITDATPNIAYIALSVLFIDSHYCVINNEVFENTGGPSPNESHVPLCGNSISTYLLTLVRHISVDEVQSTPRGGRGRSYRE
uniref:Uncharacterized protein n=1 Tax=Coleochaete scutata TaxID=3125 RepID=A0A5P9NW10_COLSC|nr:hypothetical protein [Coleochaete scutata]QFU80115.1 hypothetical protein [Coleochaete scutata]